MTSRGHGRRRTRLAPSNKQCSAALLCLFVGTLLSGCTVWQNARRTILDEPSQYSWMCDRKRSVEVYQEWADQAWREQCASHPRRRYSSAYVGGFKDGFVDYVFAGGSGEPPAVPPRQFWNVEERNPRGHTQADQWFAGFRLGAQVAHNEGYREQTIVPASVFNLGPERDSWEDAWHEHSRSSEPFTAPRLDAPHLPEAVPPGRPIPEETSDFSEPTFPQNGTPNAADIPRESPNKADSPEAMPVPARGPFGEETPPPPEPRIRNRETPPVEPGIDSIFDSAEDERGLEQHTILTQSHIEDTQQDSVERTARIAFATAIRGGRKPHAANAKLSKPVHHWNVHYEGDPSLQEVRKRPQTSPAQNRDMVPLTPVSSSRPAEIPKSRDRAEEMFRQLSR